MKATWKGQQTAKELKINMISTDARGHPSDYTPKTKLPKVNIAFQNTRDLDLDLDLKIYRSRAGACMSKSGRRFLLSLLVLCAQ